MAEYNVYLRDKNLKVLGMFTRISRIDINLLFNAPSNYAIVLQHADPLYSLIDKKSGIVIERNGYILLSGPIRQTKNTWSQKSYTVTLTGSDDTVFLASRLCYPDVAGPPYTAYEYDVRTGILETIVKQLVYYNGGMGATSPRRINGLTIQGDYGRGATVTSRARFGNLLDTIEALCGDTLGFRIRNMQFEMYDIEDKTSILMFSAEAGNLSNFEYVESIASANYVIAGGSGTGTSRVFEEDEDTDSVLDYGRIEDFLDARETSDPIEMNEKIQEELSRTAYSFSLSMQPLELSGYQFMTDYQLGNKVLFTLDETKNIEAIIKAIRITTDLKKETIIPTMSVGETKSTAESMINRLDNLEKTQ